MPFSGFESPSDASFSSLFLHHGSSFFESDDGLLTTMASDECVDMAGNVSPDNDEVFVQCLKEVLEPRDKQEPDSGRVEEHSLHSAFLLPEEGSVFVHGGSPLGVSTIRFG